MYSHGTNVLRINEIKLMYDLLVVVFMIMLQLLYARLFANICTYIIASTHKSEA